MEKRFILKKTVCTLILIILIYSLIPCGCFAAIKGQGFAGENDFDGTSDIDTVVEKPAVAVISIVRIAGATIAVVMLFTIAIKYMTSAAGDRADIKKHAVAYVVGAFILFGAVGILGVLNDIGKEIGN